MKSQPKQSKQLTLGDVAYVFQGIGTRDLKLGQEPGKDFVACWAVGASAIDGTAAKLNRAQYVPATISKRLVDNPLRGSGQMAKLEGRDILIANRGNYKVSNLVGLVDPGETYPDCTRVYPAATVLVVRPKEKYEWPWRLLALLDSSQVRDRLLKSASGIDGEGRVITKSDLEALPLPPNYHTLAEQFHNKTRGNLERLEVLDARLSKLRRAEIQAKVWRELHAPPSLPAYAWLSNEAADVIPGLLEVQEKKLSASSAFVARSMAVVDQHKVKIADQVHDDEREALRAEVARLENLERGIYHDFIKEIFIALREHADFKPAQKIFADAFKKAHGLDFTPEAMRDDALIGRILAEPIDILFVDQELSSTTRMTPGVMDLMAAAAAKFKSVVVLNPGAGHLPAAIASKGGPLVSVLPTLSGGSALLSFAKAYAQVASGQAVFIYESADEYIKAVEKRMDFQWKREAVIADAGTAGSARRLFKEALEKISRGVDDHGVCFAYVAFHHFSRIQPLLERIVSLTVLPPLPANPKISNKAFLAQGFLVEIAMNKTQARGMVAIFDATKIVPIEKVGYDLDSAAVQAIGKAIHDDTSVDGVIRTTVKREVFVRHEEWPGLISLLGLSYDMLTSATPETIHDERKRLELEKERLDAELLKDDDAGLVFPRMQAAKAAEND